MVLDSGLGLMIFHKMSPRNHHNYCTCNRITCCPYWMKRIPRTRPKETVKATPTTRDRGTGDWNIRGIMIVLLCGKPTFISLPVSPPIYRSKSAKFQLCTTAWSIIIFMPTARPYLCFVFVFFLNLEAEIINNYSPSPNGFWVNSPWGRRPNGLLTQRPWGREE